MPSRKFVSVLKYAMAVAAILAVGILLGRVIFGPQIIPVATDTEPKLPSPSERGPSQFTNIQFVDSDAEDGQVEFKFELLTPVTMKGDINHPEIQKVLSYALLNDQNPGVRLRAVNSLKEQESKQPDPSVRNCLLQAMKEDANDRVRKEALLALQKYPLDEELKEAFLYVLQKDSNPSLRIEAIKSLQPKNDDQEVRTVLKDRMESDENSFIRDKAKRLLQDASM